STASGQKLRFGRRNVILLGAAIVSLVAGYFLLPPRGTPPAAGLLLLGGCGLFPLGISLYRGQFCRSPPPPGSGLPSFPGVSFARTSGRIAQLVQSACLTRRMSGVRIPLRPLCFRPVRQLPFGSDDLCPWRLFDARGS